MDKVLIIMENQSILMVSLEQKFREKKYDVVTSSANIDKVSRIKEQFSAIIIFSDDELIKHQQSLNYLKDKMVEEEIPAFLIGSEEEMTAIDNAIPKHLFQEVFLRPINVKALVEAVDTFIQKYSNENKKKILVVDDSGAMLRSVKGWLQGTYQVALANSAAMAIKYLALNRPDLILLDYEMPVVDGKQVLEMIRSESDFNEIPVIFLTSKGDKQSIMNVMALKPDGYLLKTMEPAMIVSHINDFFEKRKTMNLKRS